MAAGLGVVVTKLVGVPLKVAVSVAVIDSVCVAVIVQEAVGVGDHTDTVAV